MDSYEAFFDEYVAFMKKYSQSNGTDMSLLNDYTTYMSKYADTMTKFEALKEADLSVAETSTKKKVKEFGYSMEDEYLYYSVILHNPNENKAIELPSFRITARDASGAPLATEEQTLSIIYPKQDFVHAFQAFDVDELPATVDIEVLDAEEYNIKEVSMLDNPKYTPLNIINATFRTDSIVGEIQNDNNYDIESGVVTVVFRDADGKLIGGESTYVDSIKANSTTPFDLSIYNDFVTDNYEIYANIW